MNDPLFLTLDELLGIHADQIRRYGGRPGLRVHLARNHPFVDGNKRTALMCALVFLGLNDQRLETDPNSLYEYGVAAGSVDRAAVSVFLRDRCVDR